ncbi:MAG: hypothetical protein JWP31_2509 [Aeromicrobium sp.]|nr:hypothetical protein [Aeromicrobium sp.]
MARRVAQLIALGLAVALAVGAGMLVRRQLDGPDPVEVVKVATLAYAGGDCAALRDVSESPRGVDCDDVDAVRDAYRREGLEPAAFTYTLVARQGDTATVRISYERDGQPQDELVRLERHGGDWKIAPTVDRY